MAARKRRRARVTARASARPWLVRVRSWLVRARPWLVRARPWLIYAFVLWTFVSILQVNVVRPYVLHGKSLAAAAAQAPAPVRGLADAYDTIVGGANRIGMASVWRMYSPVPRRIREVRFEALDAKGQWTAVSGPGATPAHRRERSLADALLWDFKRARINDNYFLTRYEEFLPWLYLGASRDRIARELGEPPQALRVRVRSAPIPAPADKGDWDPTRAVFDQVDWESAIR
jgi:hypothetical protein